MEERVLYCPAKSMGFGHSARVRDVRQAWAKTLAFLERHTVCQMRDRIGFQFPSTAVDAPGEYLNHVREALGPQTGQPPYHVWTLTKAQFDLCLRLALEEARWPQPSGSMFSFCYDFVWRQQGIQHIPPYPPHGQVPQASMLNVLIRYGRVFLQPLFFFPYSHDAPEIHAFIRALAADLPFRFSPHHFQRVYPAKRGNVYNARRLPKEWLQGAA